MVPRKTFQQPYSVTENSCRNKFNGHVVTVGSQALLPSKRLGNRGTAIRTFGGGEP